MKYGLNLIVSQNHDSGRIELSNWLCALIGLSAVFPMGTSNALLIVIKQSAIQFLHAATQCQLNKEIKSAIGNSNKGSVYFGLLLRPIHGWPFFFPSRFLVVWNHLWSFSLALWFCLIMTFLSKHYLSLYNYKIAWTILL